MRGGYPQITRNLRGGNPKLEEKNAGGTRKLVEIYIFREIFIFRRFGDFCSPPFFGVAGKGGGTYAIVYYVAYLRCARKAYREEDTP